MHPVVVLDHTAQPSLLGQNHDTQVEKRRLRQQQKSPQCRDCLGHALALLWIALLHGNIDVAAQCTTGPGSGLGISTIANSTECPSPSSLYVNSATGIVYAACLDGGVISINGDNVTMVATQTQCFNPVSVYVVIRPLG